MSKKTIKRVQAKMKRISINSRHPTEKNCTISTPTPPLISCGTQEKKVLRYLFENSGSRFNIKAYSRLKKIPRSTIYSLLDRLKFKGLIVKESHANHKISDIGISILDVESGGVESVRRGCRDLANLSQHYTRYVLPIVDNSNFRGCRVKELDVLDSKVLELPNLKQYYLYYSDATIIINPKQVVIRVHDLVEKETEETLLKSFNKAVFYARVVDGIGVKCERILLENAHFARVESFLADFISRIDDNYFLDLGEGVKFWVDNSGGKSEDETNDVVTRERLDEVLEDAIKSDSLLSDLDKMKGVVGSVIKSQVLGVKTMQGVQENQLIFADNMKSHIKAVQLLGESTKSLNGAVISLKNEVKGRSKDKVHIKKKSRVESPDETLLRRGKWLR